MIQPPEWVDVENYNNQPVYWLLKYFYKHLNAFQAEICSGPPH